MPNRGNTNAQQTNNIRLMRIKLSGWGMPLVWFMPPILPHWWHPW